MKQFINKNKIIEANINEPYENEGENWDMTNTRGWELVLTVGYDERTYPIKITIPKESEKECIDTVINLGLTQL